MDNEILEPGDDRDPPHGSYKPGNTDANGDYIVGKYRPPQATKFARGDGRKRGRRPKGQRNFDTEFAEEAQRKVTIREGGVERKVTKIRAAIIRALDNAGSKGQNPAIANIFSHGARIAADMAAQTSSSLTAREDALLQDWLARRQAIPTDDLPGDLASETPEPTEDPVNEAPGNG